MAEHKKQGQGRRLIVTGCLAERYREELRKEIPEIDAVLGTGEVTGLVDALSSTGTARSPSGASAQPLTFYSPDPGRELVPRSGEAASGRASARSRPQGDTPVFGLDLPTYLYDADTPRRRATPAHYAYVKIAEGCDYKCAFCIIPKMRGHYRSRSIESIVQEARRLAAEGVRELLLISQGHDVLRHRSR